MSDPLLQAAIALWGLTGINFTFWALISAIRYLLERAILPITTLLLDKLTTTTPTTNRFQASDVAVILAAHNEEVALGKTIEGLLKIVPASQIYIGSDASTDRTVPIARSYQCHVQDLSPNRGKAKVLVHLLQHYQLYDKYKLVFIIDADIIVDPQFLTHALPLFNDRQTAAVAGHAISLWPKHRYPRWSLLATAYRVRLWRLLEYGLKYGQTWKYLNVSSIIPGGSSMYRTDVLRQIHIDAPDLVIEDYNMTFEVHRQKLGKIGFDPRANILDQEPYSLRDYTRQVARWNLGWWQTIRRHGFWISFFSIFTTLFVIELLLYALFTLLVPAMLIWFVLHPNQQLILPLYAWITPGNGSIAATDILIGIFVIDYAITAAVTIIERKPLLLIYGLAFPLIRYIDAFIFLYTIPLSLLITSTGRWTSPTRR